MGHVIALRTTTPLDPTRPRCEWCGALLRDGGPSPLCADCLAVKHRRQRVSRVASGLYDDCDIMERQDWHSYEVEPPTVGFALSTIGNC